ncbi:MAG: O-antigen ligase family protein [Paracoccaceae bacterium]
MKTLAQFWDLGPVDAMTLPVSRAGFQLIRPMSRKWPGQLAAMVLISVVLLAPIPAASNHPLAWMLWATVIGLTGALVMATTGRAQAIRTRHVKLMLALGFVLLGVAIWQALPMRGIRGGVLISLPSGTTNLPSLSIAPSATFVAALRVASYLVFFVLMLWISRDARRSKRIGLVLFYGISAHALWAMISLNLLGDIQLVGEKSAYLGVATGAFIGRSAFATFLGMGLVLGLAFLLVEPSRARRKDTTDQRLQRAIMCISLMIILIALVSTQSRMGIASSLLAVFAGVLPWARSRRRISIWSAAIFIAVLAYYGEGLSGRVTHLAQSSSTRIELYAQVFEMIRMRPLFGFGLDSFPLAYELFHAPPVSAGFVWDRAHSTYLTLWAEAGVIAGSAPPLAGLVAAHMLWRGARKRGPNGAMATAGFAALLLCGLHALFDFSLEIQANTFLLLALVALGLGSMRSAKGTK